MWMCNEIIRTSFFLIVHPEFWETFLCAIDFLGVLFRHAISSEIPVTSGAGKGGLFLSL